MRPIALLSLFAITATCAPAQQTPSPSDQSPVTVTVPYLSNEQIAVAVDRGLSNKDRQVGIHVVDIDSAIQAGMSCNHCGGATYTVNAFTPMQWIESRARLYKQHNRPFTTDSVTPQMRSPAFRVYAYEVRRATGKMELPDPIKDVQLADVKQKQFLKPLTEKEHDANGEHSDSTTSKSGSTEATIFDMKEVDKLSNNGTSDIFVVITSQSGHSKYMKIKAQDLKE
jgi:hypothetical protein